MTREPSRTTACNGRRPLSAANSVLRAVDRVVAGMGADLFGSFAEATCASLVLSAAAPGLAGAGWAAMMFPLVLASVGLVACLLASFVATDLSPVRMPKAPPPPGGQCNFSCNFLCNFFCNVLFAVSDTMNGL